MEKLNYSQKLGPQIDSMIERNVPRAEALEAIQDYIAAKLELGIEMKSSAIQHYESRPGHFLKSGAKSEMKAEGNKSGAAQRPLNKGLSDEEKAALKDYAMKIFAAPLGACEEIGIPSGGAFAFHIIHVAFAALEELGKIEFSKAALEELTKAEEQAALANALELIKKCGAYKIEEIKAEGGAEGGAEGKGKGKGK